MKTMKTIVIALIAGIAIAGCMKEDDVAYSQLAGPPGRNFEVNLTDGPANFSRLDIEITGVEAYHDSRGWITLNATLRSVDILSLSNGVSKTIATSANVETGHYSRLRIRFGDRNTVTVHTPVTIGATVISPDAPSALGWTGTERFVDIPIDESVSDRMGARVMLDFDAAASVYAGVNSYMIKPEIRAMKNMITGVSGRIMGAQGSAFIVLSNERYSYCAYADARGQFVIRGMTEGVYHAMVNGVVRNDKGILEERSITRENIKVTQGVVTPITGQFQF